MNIFSTFSASTVAIFEQAVALARRFANEDASVDMEIAADHGSLDEDAAEDYLSESDTYTKLRCTEVRANYREAYLATWKEAA